MSLFANTLSTLPHFQSYIHIWVGMSEIPLRRGASARAWKMLKTFQSFFFSTLSVKSVEKIPFEAGKINVFTLMVQERDCKQVCSPKGVQIQEYLTKSKNTFTYSKKYNFKINICELPVIDSLSRNECMLDKKLRKL